MADTEVAVELEGGAGSALPRKRPTVIRPGHVVSGPARPAPARPAPPPPGVGHPPTPAPPSVTPVAAPQKQVSDAMTTPLKCFNPPAKDVERPKSQGSVRRRPEITVVDARPMSEAGFRDLKGESQLLISSRNGAVTASPVPQVSPGPARAPLSTQPLLPPAPASQPPGPAPAPGANALASDLQPDNNLPGQLSKPARPTILRPSTRPKSMVVAGSHQTDADDKRMPPPPPLPKRSPIVMVGQASNDLVSIEPPPKPQRVMLKDSSQLSKAEGDDGSKTVEDQDSGHTTPKKPMRMSIIRPPPRPRPLEEGSAGDFTDTPEDHHHLTPKPPVPAPHPVGALRSPSSQPQPDPAAQPVTHLPPLPAARPRVSPRDGSQPQDSAETMKTIWEEEGVPAAPSRPKPPVPPVRPQDRVADAALSPPSPGHQASVRLPQSSSLSSSSSAATNKMLSQALASSVVPSSLLPSPTIPPPPIPAKEPAHESEGSGLLYAVSDPLDASQGHDSVVLSPHPHHPSRPPPPPPPTRPSGAPQHRPLSVHSVISDPSKPRVPSLSSGSSPAPEKPSQIVHDGQGEQAKGGSFKDQPHHHPVSAHEPAAFVVDTGDEISALYAKISKPKKSTQDAFGDPTTNPFNVTLKHVPAEGSSPEVSEPSCGPNIAVTEVTERRKPTLLPRSKPDVAKKPEILPKLTSPKPDQVQEEICIPEPSTVQLASESLPQPIPRPMAAKRPTIIRPQAKPSVAPKPECKDQNSSMDDGDVHVQLREKTRQGEGQAQGDQAERMERPREAPVPNPPRRPVTIIGFPHHKQHSLDNERKATEKTSPPLPQQRPSTVGAQGGVMLALDTAATVDKHLQPSSEKTGHPPLAGTRPPPPRPYSHPARQPDQPIQTPAPAHTLDVEIGAEHTASLPPPPRPSEGPVSVQLPPPRPSEGPVSAQLPPHRPSHAPRPDHSPPPKPSQGPAHETEAEPTASKSSAAAEAALRTPRPAGSRPSRPLTMPPLHLSASKHEKPARPTAPKESKMPSPPPLPHRPGLTHPLYRYMAVLPHAIALYDYAPTQPDELPFEEGDLIGLLKRVDEQWLQGVVKDKEGIFPQNFVNIIHPLHNEVPTSAIEDDLADSVFDDTPPEKPDNLQGPRCRARFDFDGEGHDDLSFEDGDVIRLVAHCGSDWLKGELNGKLGMFPASFVEIIEDLPLDGESDCAKLTEKEVTALFDFNGEAGELSFQAGDRIKVLSKIDDQWLFGEIDGCQGSFPACFVDHIPNNLPVHETHHVVSASPTSDCSASGGARCASKPPRLATALYNFDKTQEGDLEFHAGDLIEVLEEVSGDWLKGHIDGREGIFPAGFVQWHLEEEQHSVVNQQHRSATNGQALFDFKGETDNELTFQAGDQVVLGEMVSDNSEWQWGELGGRRGVFPASFVQPL